MKISCQSIINPERPAQGIKDLKNAGFTGIMLGVGAHFPETKDLHNVSSGGQDAAHDRSREEWLQQKYAPETIGIRYEALLGECKENGIRIAVVNTPGMPYKVEAEADYNAFLFKCAVEGIRLCNRAGCGYVIIPPLRTEHGKIWEANREYYLTLAQTAKKYDVQILLKNQAKKVGGRLVRGSCAEPSRAVEWIDRLNGEAGEERFGLCLDIGMCILCGNDIHEFILQLGKRIKAVIMKECMGQKEAALLPYVGGDSGTVWLGVVRGLRDIRFDGELLFNFAGTVRTCPPLLRPALFRFAYKTAEYLGWQIRLEQGMRRYKKIVLFGAGNMCRNYMKNYGDKYPPLFTCDNNAKLWGTEFCGLEVKSPEALKELPEDCGIFICNIYYREIEEQLRAMGIDKNIEYFNDEYMPSFYPDRLDMTERER